MKKLFSCFLFLCLPMLAGAQMPKSFEFKSGDLIFQDLDCGGLCDAIEAVTPGVGGKHFSHVGLVYVEHDTIVSVIEAIGKDVHLTPIQSFLNRQLDEKGNAKIVVGRLEKQYRYFNKGAIAFALKQLGTPYDDAFMYDNGSYYCSELIYDAYKHSYSNHPFFELSPMTFNDPATGQLFPAWADYYKGIGKPVPEGMPGCNPGSIANSDKIQIIYYNY